MYLTGDGLSSLDPANGDVFWQYPVKDEAGENSATPVRAGDFLVASTVKFGGVGLKLETKDGKPTASAGLEEPRPELLLLDAGGRRAGSAYMVTGEFGVLAGRPRRCTASRRKPDMSCGRRRTSASITPPCCGPATTSC